MAFVRDEGDAGVKADVGLTHHRRVGSKKGVPGRVFHHGGLVRVAQGVVAKRHSARRFAHGHAHGGLEPLPLGIQKIHHCHGRAAQPRRQHGQLVERIFVVSVQNRVLCQRPQPGGIGGRQGRGLQGGHGQTGLRGDGLRCIGSGRSEKFTSMEWPGPRQGGMDKLGGTWRQCYTLKQVRAHIGGGRRSARSWPSCSLQPVRRVGTARLRRLCRCALGPAGAHGGGQFLQHRHGLGHADAGVRHRHALL